MKYYLSSYSFGDNPDKLKDLIKPGSVIGHIDNAKDFLINDASIRRMLLQDQMDMFSKLGCTNTYIDLRTYFGKTQLLSDKLSEVQGLWVTGGNTFVLRQAMRLSGFDSLFEELRKRKDFFYGGYSAGICILSDSLKYLETVDKPDEFPYNELSTSIYEGLNVFKYGFIPHYGATYTDSEALVSRCKQFNWPYVTLRDGDVIICEE